MNNPKQIAPIFVVIISLFTLAAFKTNESVTLKILSYNIHHGEGMDKRLDLSRYVEIINSVAPDLCGLQEVDNFCLRTDRVGQTDYLAERTAMSGTFGKFMDFQGGEYGMATLSAKPLISSTILALPDGVYEPRSAIVQEVQVTPACTIAFANVHFDWIDGAAGNTNRMKQARALVQYLDSLKLPAVITGDFNCRPDSPVMQYFDTQGFVFVKKGRDNLSFQGENKAEIDHLIYRNAGRVKIKTRRAQLLAAPVASDHRPFLVELRLRL